jgi:DNA helicase TIP49 (TBP-interacting protein)
MIVKTDAYTREQIGKVVQMRANVEGIKLLPDVLDKLAGEGEKSSLRYVSLSFLLIMYRYLLGDSGKKLRPSTADPCIYSCRVVGAEAD